MKRSIYAISSGFCASAASLFGKLSGASIFEDLLFMKILCFVMMIVCNAFVWTSFAKALQNSSSSLSATLISTATNYLFSAVIGLLVFNETTSLLWWFGMGLVFLGLILIINGQKEHEKDR